MTEWYDKGRQEVLDNIAEIIFGNGKAPTMETAVDIYGWLSEQGFIDYDVEKEIFYEWFGDEQDG